jgi:hypothetical protein
MDKSKIDILCEYLNNNVAERYPIENEELVNNTDYIKNGYLKMLAVVLQQSETIYDSQLNMFKRIVSGAKTDKKAEDYLRMALDIEIEDYIKFSNECKDLNLKYRWVLDAMIIICVQNKQPEQIVLVAQFCESLKITKKELNYIATMAGAIVKMSAFDYVCAYEIKEDTIPDYVFSDYMYLVSNGCVCSNEHMTILQARCREDVTVQILEKIKEINTPCIKIIGAIIDADDCKIFFENREKVILENCKFIGGNKNSLLFNCCSEIIISNSCFENFSERTLIFNHSNSIMVRDCKFKNCKKYHCANYDDWNELGGVIYSERPSSIERFDLINSLFVDCGGENGLSFYPFAFISNIKSFVDNCSFENCWHTNGDGKDIVPDHEKPTMFTEESSATNCKYVNSARFN